MPGEKGLPGIGFNITGPPGFVTLKSLIKLQIIFYSNNSDLTDYLDVKGLWEMWVSMDQMDRLETKVTVEKIVVFVRQVFLVRRENLERVEEEDIRGFKEIEACQEKEETRV